MQRTTNYGLNKPNYSDQYDLRHWNDNMDLIDAQMKSEETARIQSDTILQANIDSEATARQNADTTLQGNIDSEASTRSNADTTLQGNIDEEVTARTNADTQIKTDLGNGTLVADKANKDGDGNVIKTTYEKNANKTDSWGDEPSTSKYPTERLVKASLESEATARTNGDALKVDKTVQVRVSDGSNYGAYVTLDGSAITIVLPSSIYGAVFN